MIVDCMNGCNSQCMNGCNGQCPWEIYAMVEDTKSWAASKKCFFVWCNREKNRVAHWLASNSLCFSSGCIPPDLASLVTFHMRSLSH